MERSVKPVFFHVDMDAFFASVEQLDTPSLRGQPVIVGAQPGRRGVVSACSYEARKFGVHSAMPISEAYRRCPAGFFMPVRMKRYQEVSKHIMKIFSGYTPVVQQISVDEAFLDMSGTERLLGPPEQVGRKLKEKVRAETGLTISVGIAPNRYLAKLASAHDKPDGLCIIGEGEEFSFMNRLELKDIWGIGEKTLLRLAELNIRTMDELSRHEEASLRLMLGKAAGSFLYKAARGIDPGIFTAEPRSRSISAETTFEQDTANRDLISRTILDLSHQIMFRLIDEGFRSKTVNLKLRYSDFTTTTVQKTLRHEVGSAEEIHRTSLDLLSQRWNGTTTVRLIGVGLSSLEPLGDGAQQELFEDEYSRKKKVEQAILLMQQRGKAKVTKASLLTGTKKRLE